VSWERLESATVDPQLDEGLEARLADPAWLLARQWQAGEFRGEDAANPLLIQLEARSMLVDRVVTHGGRSVVSLDVDTPLEPLVEAEAVRRGPAGARVAAELGLMLLTALARLGVPAAARDELRARHPVALARDDGLDPVGRRRLELLARRSLDGVALAAELDGDPTLIDGLLDALGVVDSARGPIATVMEAWRASTSAAFQEPAAAATWDASRMEYGFELRATAATGDVRLVADGYVGGRVEWHTFDRVDVATPTAPPSTAVTRRAEVLPVRLRFRGMPASRFWAFELGDVSFGAIDAGPEDLARVAVAGYATVYGDDWYVVPLRVPTATLTAVTRLRVLDDFGAATDIPAAAVVDGGGDDRPFKFFELTGDPGPAAGRPPALFLPPSVETADAGRPLEDVRLVRDEVGNLAWAVERRVESAAGRPVDLTARAASLADAPDEPATEDDRWRLVLSTAPPEAWVPLVPVRLGAGGAIRLQRGRVPVAGRGTRGARGRILEPERRLLLHEEEVLSTDVAIVRRFQSARDQRGRLHTWVGRRKGPTRGQGTSGLVFDVLETD
jgi:hypothetical protein